MLMRPEFTSDRCLKLEPAWNLYNHVLIRREILDDAVGFAQVIVYVSL